MIGATGKSFLRLAGSSLGGYLDDALGIGGKIGQQAATAALKAGKAKFAPSMAATGKEVPAFLREGSRAIIPTAGKLVGQGAVVGAGLAAANMMDQQSTHTQPMSTGAGSSEINNFLMSQQLQNQKFMHDMMLVQARAESRIPGAQYAGSLNPMASGRAFEKSILDEVGIFGRGIYGTGTRL